MEVIGWVGTALVVVAYYPQIHHLFVERCAWGISPLTWVIWLFASCLLLIYCALRRDWMMCFVQGVNIAAIVTTLILVRRSYHVCPHHRKVAGTATRGEKSTRLTKASSSVCRCGTDRQKESVITRR